MKILRGTTFKYRGFNRLPMITSIHILPSIYVQGWDSTVMVHFNFLFWWISVVFYIDN